MPRSVSSAAAETELLAAGLATPSRDNRPAALTDDWATGFAPSMAVEPAATTEVVDAALAAARSVRRAEALTLTTDAGDAIPTAETSPDAETAEMAAGTAAEN